MNGFWRTGPLALRMGALLTVSALTASLPFVAHAEETVKPGIFGHVVLGDNNPLVGVVINLGDSDKVYARTDAAGRYKISNLLAQSYTVRPMKRGFKFTPESRVIALPTTGKPTSPLGEVNFRAAKRTDLAISGLIRTVAGKPLSGAKVTISGEGFTARSTGTNLDGIYRLEKLPYGRYTVTPTRAGFTIEPAQRSLTIPVTGGEFAPNGRANFNAKPVVTPLKANIYGLILDAGRKGVAGVKIFNGNGSVALATTNSEGRYVIVEPGKGRYVLKPVKEGFSFDPASQVVELPTAGQTSSPHAIANFLAKTAEVPAKARIFGRVTNAEGDLITGVGIFLGDGTVAVATTGNDGKYLIPDLALGRYVVRAKKEGATFDPASRVVELPTTGKPTSPDGEANFIIKPVVAPVNANIYGRVTSAAGTGVAGVSIFIGDGSAAAATTNAEGRYVITNPGRGRYVLVPKKEGATFDPASRVVELPTTGQESSPHATANFVLKEAAPASYIIRGRVTSGGAGLAGVGIFVGESSVAITTTNSEGRYAIEKLAAGRYVVKAQKTGTTFEPASRVVELPTAGATTSPNGEANFEAKVAATKYLIRGRVTGGTGAPLAGVAIRIADVVRATTNAEGRYVIEGLEAGSYNVIPRKERFTFTPAYKTVKLPTTEGGALPHAEVNFVGTEAVSTYSISGTIKTSGGVAVSGVAITLGDSDRVVATTNEEGAYSITGLAAGTYGVHPHREGATFTPEGAAVAVPANEGTSAPNARRDFIAVLRQ